MIILAYFITGLNHAVNVQMPWALHANCRLLQDPALAV